MKKEPIRHNIPIEESDESSDENETNVKIVKKKHEAHSSPKEGLKSNQRAVPTKTEPIVDKNISNSSFCKILSQDGGAEKSVNVIEQFPPKNLSKGKPIHNRLKIFHLIFDMLKTFSQFSGKS